jgi:hypothetical protein
MRDDGARGVSAALRNRLIGGVYQTGWLQELVKTGLLACTSRYPIGRNVYERDWDLLVILDTCRVDALREAAPEYDFLDDIEAVWSVGSATAEWTANTFTRSHVDEIRDTVCVTANGTVEWTLEGDNTQLENDLVAPGLTNFDMASPEDFLLLDSVWEYGPRDPFGGLVVPKAVTDRVIQAGRNEDADRLIAHYMPPHAPHRSRAIAENRSLEFEEGNPWKALRNGASKPDIWGNYLADLRWVLDTVEDLLRNVDAEEVVITADHGDAFGEYGVYSHPMGVPHPHVRKVPWARTSATDSGEYSPQLDRDPDVLDRAVGDQLEKLGYL